MNKQNTEKLLEKYPKIFIQHTWPITKSCMGWLFECGNGWFALIDVLCGLIQRHCDEVQKDTKDFQIEAVQVKEKYGGLRFYTHYGDDYTETVIEFAENMSYSICEECGTTKDAKPNEGGWISTRCPMCRWEENGED